MATTFTPAADEAAARSALSKVRMDTGDLTADGTLLLRDAQSGIKAFMSSDDDGLLALEYRGAVIEAKTPTVFHYEGGSLFNPVYISAVSGTPTATGAVVGLTDASYKTHGADKLTSLTVDEQVFIINPTTGQEAHAVVTSVSHLVNTPAFGSQTARTGVSPAHMQEGDYTLGYNASVASGRLFTLAWLSGTALNAADFLAADTIITAYNGTFPEGGYFAMEGKLWDFIKFTAEFQPISATHMETGRAATTHLSFSVEGKTQTWDVQKMMTVKLARMRETLTLFHGPGGTATLQGKSMNFMKGLWPTAKARGNRFTYTGTFDAAAFIALTKAMAKNNSAKSYTLEAGIDLISDIETGLITLGAGGGLIYGNLGNGDTVMKMSLKGFSRNGITIFFKASAGFTHKTTFGLSNTMQGSGVLYPNSNTEGVDPDGTPWSNQAVQLRYLARNGQRYHEVLTGAETQRRDVKGVDIFTDCTPQFSRVREFYTIEKVG